MRNRLKDIFDIKQMRARTEKEKKAIVFYFNSLKKDVNVSRNKCVTMIRVKRTSLYYITEKKQVNILTNSFFIYLIY